MDVTELEAERLKAVIAADRPTLRQMSEIAEMRERLWAQSRALPKCEPLLVRYLSKEFRVSRDVFCPQADSQPLVTNMRIAKGARVLDVGTGCGVIAIHAAWAGASIVLATDIDAAAVLDTQVNAETHGVGSNVIALVSDVFDNVPITERFDIITANLPFTRADINAPYQRTMLDPGFSSWKRLLGEGRRFLNSGGILYVAQANFGNTEILIRLAEEGGWGIQLVARQAMEMDPRVFYAFRLWPKTA